MPAKTTKIIFFGDISGVLGRKGVKEMAPRWRRKFKADLVIANVENLAHNKGVTLKTLDDIASANIDVMTGGNHIWAKYDIDDLARETDYALACPANDLRTPQKYVQQEIEVKGTKLFVINLLGQTFMDDSHTSNPFHKIDLLLQDIPAGANIIIDIHAETTSEKRAMGFYLDGRVSAVLGTHTHVATADQQILAKGTAYTTDIGMNGPLDSVLGIKKDIIIKKFLSEERISHEVPESGQIEVNALLLEIDNSTNRAIKIKRLREIID